MVRTVAEKKILKYVQESPSEEVPEVRQLLLRNALRFDYPHFNSRIPHILLLPEIPITVEPRLSELRLTDYRINRCRASDLENKIVTEFWRGLGDFRSHRVCLRETRPYV